jgi:hypothetical protein
MKQEMKFANFKDIEKSIEIDVWLIKTSPSLSSASTHYVLENVQALARDHCVRKAYKWAQ